jgi:hypothetical protein
MKKKSDDVGVVLELFVLSKDVLSKEPGIIDSAIADGVPECGFCGRLLNCVFNPILRILKDDNKHNN